MDNGIEKITSGTHIPFWIGTAAPITFGPLTKNKKTHVVIIGGGIAGVSIGCRLSMEGMRVILVEDGNIGSGETGRTTAHLVTSLDDRYYDLQKRIGKEAARLAAKSHGDAINYAEKLINMYRIDCDFHRMKGYLFSHPSDKTDSIEKEYHAATESGLHVSLLDQAPGLKKDTGPCLEFFNQARFHPLKYLKGLCDIMVRMGSEIYTATHISEIRDGSVVTSDGHTIVADHIVVATNSPISNKYKVHLKQFPFRSYVIAAPVAKDPTADAMYWDTGDFDVDPLIPPYHYVRRHPWKADQDMLICGGEDHNVGIIGKEGIREEDRYSRLEEWMRSYFDAGAIAYRWSGEIFETMDGLAHIGHNPGAKSNIYIATGDSGNGITHGIIASFIIPDLIGGRPSEFESIYDPSRLHLFRGSKRWMKEFLGAYFRYKKEIPKHDESELITIEKNEGKVITIEKKKYAVYKDENGHMHFLDAECTHLGCIVKWNNDEKSWDCPCHGSRFTFTGEVLNGPAVDPLPYMEIPSEEDRMPQQEIRYEI